MKRLLVLASALLLLSLVPLFSGCDKERIVESTEYIEKIEYVDVPADTVIVIDTVVIRDSVSVNTTDTVVVIDTVYSQTTIHDTITVVQNHYDTTIVTVTDTVVTVQHHYDTVEVVSFAPNGALAFTAMQAYSDQLVIDFITQEFGYTDGWVLYLSTYQVDLQQQSAGVYDIYGYIDYWLPDWSAYYPLEFYWRMSYDGGDPADPNNWSIAEPTSSIGHEPGISLSADARRDMLDMR
ncbi:MAG: hypothetical protein RBT76_13235 [candidate division Zixibacteria bacterium]|jgi:hypothetical protein|nr:hypothetical protein [candidate division Zixibacteria bacterium]